MFVQILSTSTIRNVWRTVRRICILILELKGVNRDFALDFEAIFFTISSQMKIVQIQQPENTKKNVSHQSITFRFVFRIQNIHQFEKNC